MIKLREGSRSVAPPSTVSLTLWAMPMASQLPADSAYLILGKSVAGRGDRTVLDCVGVWE